LDVLGEFFLDEKFFYGFFMGEGEWVIEAHDEQFSACKNVI
jgi:hypothetical protein